MKFVAMGIAYALLPVMWTGFLVCKLLLGPLVEDSGSIADATREWLSDWRAFAYKGIV